MAYDEFLADRVNRILSDKKVNFEEKKMMGGLCYMVEDKMCVGISKSLLMARIDPDFTDKALKKKGCIPMDFTGKPMKGFVFVEPKGTDSDKDIEFWVDKCLEFNPKAKASKKRAKKKG